MTPEQLREHAKQWDDDGRYSIGEVFRAHAAALEELARVKRDLGIMTKRADNEERATERAERAEAALAECRSKLEVDPRTKYDGIDCRDETIRMLEQKCERLIDVALHKFGIDLSAELKEDKP